MGRRQYTLAEKQLATRRSQERRLYTQDHTVALRGAEKEARIDLGLALLQRAALPGVCYDLEEIADWCGCTNGAIMRIQNEALKKLRKRFRLMKDPRLVALMEEYFYRRTPAVRKEQV